MLPAKIRRQLERWLFVEQLTYREVARLMGERFNVRTSITSVGEYYRRKGKLQLQAAGHDKEQVMVFPLGTEIRIETTPREVRVQINQR